MVCVLTVVAGRRSRIVVRFVRQSSSMTEQQLLWRISILIQRTLARMDMDMAYGLIPYAYG
jgi:hypothetical protein